MITLRRGSRGRAVRFLQQRLNRHGFSVSVDGIFGSGTLAAVRQFQASRHLKTDGIVGDKTWDALRVENLVDFPDSSVSARKRELVRLVKDQPTISDWGQETAFVAIEQLGLREVPDGSNAGPEIAHIVSGYWDYWEVGPPTNRKAPPWCALFTSWCIKEAHSDSATWEDTPFQCWMGGVYQLSRWAKDIGVFRKSSDRSDLARPGEIFTMSRSGSSSDPSRTTRAGHCGIVIHDEGKFVVTVEGNISNAVGTRRRPKNKLQGFIRWWEA